MRGWQKRGASADKLRESAAEEATELSGLVEELLDARPERVDVASWYALLLTTLQALENQNGGCADGLEPGRVVYDCVSRYDVTTVRASSAPDETGHATQKVGRNDPCPCGSGKKYKKCHGSPTGGAATA